MRREAPFGAGESPVASRQSRVSDADRAAAWILTGPVGRVVAFGGDLAAAIGGWALRRVGLRRQPRDGSE